MTIDFQCEVCQRRVEVISPSGPPSPPVCHGQPMRRLWSLSTRHSTGFKPFWHPHLWHKPVLVTSWKHYRQLLAERHASNELAS